MTEMKPSHIIAVGVLNIVMVSALIIGLAILVK